MVQGLRNYPDCGAGVSLLVSGLACIESPWKILLCHHHRARNHRKHCPRMLGLALSRRAPETPGTPLPLSVNSEQLQKTGDIIRRRRRNPSRSVHDCRQKAYVRPPYSVRAPLDLHSLPLVDFQRFSTEGCPVSGRPADFLIPSKACRILAEFWRV
ncbi:hypothetical protein BDV18DRAFT_15804 [Aspergillus unguis]